MTPDERLPLIDAYAAGPERLRRAWAAVPAEARQFRPATGKWSPHEIVCHCADSETTAASRIRYLVAETDPTIVGYDQARWAAVFDYHNLPVEPALDAVSAVRSNTVALLRQLPEEAWGRGGTHTESGRYTVEDWLRTYAVHVENHAAQIERAVAVWHESRGGAVGGQPPAPTSS